MLTEHAHRHRPRLLRARKVGGCPVTTSSFASVSPEEDTRFKSERWKDEPGRTKKGRRWQGARKLLFRSGASAETIFIMCFLLLEGSVKPAEGGVSCQAP